MMLTVSSLMTKKPSRFAPANAYADMKARVLKRLKGFFNRFNGLGKVEGIKLHTSHGA